MIQRLPLLGLWARLDGVKEGVHGKRGTSFPVIPESVFLATLTCDDNIKLHTYFFRLLSHMGTLQYSLSD